LRKNGFTPAGEKQWEKQKSGKESIKRVEKRLKAYNGLERIYREAGQVMPKNKEANRKLDNAVFRHLHESRKGNPTLEYDTVRCSFTEGEEVYPGANFTTRQHIELCVLNPKCYKGFFYLFLMKSTIHT
jgi:hypothetical protein